MVIGYVEVADFETWLAARGYVVSGDAAQALAQAFDFVELQKYQGVKTDLTQITEWPRAGVVIDDISIPSDIVPQLVKQLQMRVAYDLGKGIDALGVQEQAVKSERVEGVVSVTYQDGTAQSTVSEQARLILDKLKDTDFKGGQLIMSGVTR